MKHLILVLTLALSSPSWAALTCGSFLHTQDRSTPLARVTFNTDGKQSSLIFTKSDILMPASFTTKLLTGLTSFFVGKSTTTSRVEERAVMKEEDSRKLLDQSGLRWEARDPKKPNEDFTTVTSYSEKFILDAPGDIEISVKMRSRKYYAHTKGETNPEKMTSVFGDIGALELKVKNVAGVSSDGFQVFPDAIFKPRVFISDAILQRLSKISVEKLRKESVREQLILELSDVKQGDKDLNPSIDKITEFIDALTLLLEENPDLFKPQIIVAYNRDSYSTELEDGTDYQYTLDRNIRIFEPDHKLQVGNAVAYLERTPLHTVEDGVAFAELKSPVMEKHENTPAYQKLSFALFSRHSNTFSNGSIFKEGKGKYSFGVRVRETLEQTTLSEQLYTEGVLYYLIKGVGNMPTNPKKNDLKYEGKWSIALPIEIAGENHRLILDYKSHDGEGLLNSMELIDSLGYKVDLNGGSIKNLISQIVANSKPSTITINNQALTIPGRIDRQTLEDFKEFFARFSHNPDKTDVSLRDVDELQAINSAAQLNAYIRKIKFWNKVQFVVYQIKKYTPVTLIAGALSLAITVETQKYMTSPESLNSTVQELRIENEVSLTVKGDDFQQQLTAKVMPNGNILLVPIELSPTADNPNLTVDIGAIKDIEGDSSSSVDSARMILNHPQ